MQRMQLIRKNEDSKTN